MIVWVVTGEEGPGYEYRHWVVGVALTLQEAQATAASDPYIGNPKPFIPATLPDESPLRSQDTEVALGSRGPFGLGYTATAYELALPES